MPRCDGSCELISTRTGCGRFTATRRRKRQRSGHGALLARSERVGIHRDGDDAGVTPLEGETVTPLSGRGNRKRRVVAARIGDREGLSVHAAIAEVPAEHQILDRGRQPRIRVQVADRQHQSRRCRRSNTSCCGRWSDHALAGQIFGQLELIVQRQVVGIENLQNRGIGIARSPAFPSAESARRSGCARNRSACCRRSAAAGGRCPGIAARRDEIGDRTTHHAIAHQAAVVGDAHHARAGRGATKRRRTT